jgi:hypothetical protein
MSKKKFKKRSRVARLPVSICLFLFAARPLTALASDATAQEENPSEATGEKAAKIPVVIVLMLGNDDVSRKRNESFVIELKLALDGFAIKQIETGVDDFESLVLPERLEHIRPFVDEFDAVATTWIEKTDTNATLLNLVALSTGRALVRIVEAREGPEAERELALAAQELLGEAYLFKPRQEHEAMEKVVSLVKEEVLATESRKSAGSRYGILPFFDAGGGIYGQTGQAVMFGGGFAFEISPAEKLFFRGGVSFLGYPRQRPRDGVISGWRMDPGLTVGYDWRIGDFMLGPAISAAASHFIFDMYLGYIYNQKFTWWNFHASCGLDLRVELIKDVFLTLFPSIGAYPFRKSFARLSNGDKFLVTPFVDWNLIIGIAFFR